MWDPKWKKKHTKKPHNKQKQKVFPLVTGLYSELS